jgi:stage V sporulation protein K
VAPLNDIAVSLRQIRDRLAVSSGASDALDVVREQLARPEPFRPIEDLKYELDSLVGLATVKQQVQALVAFLEVQGRRLEHGLPEVATSQHLVFLGNPGTGKTTIARLLAQMYRSMGLLKKGQLVEIDRAGLVGEYVGSTAIKTDRAIRRALDGVLFIDEAYSLAPRGVQLDFGPEAIETILKRMEDYRHRLVVIVAGYPKLMHGFLNSNPGLRSRFAREIVFPDYTSAELLAITQGIAAGSGYVVVADAERELQRIFDGTRRDEGFGNARFARTLFEQALNMQALRLAGEEEANLADLGKRELMALQASDLLAAAQALGEDAAAPPRWRRSGRN